jgi:hypothetical protein
VLPRTDGVRFLTVLRHRHRTVIAARLFDPVEAPVPSGQG